MAFIVKNSDIINQKKKCVVIGLFSNKKLTKQAQKFDSAADGMITRLLKQAAKNSKLGEVTLLYLRPDSEAEILIVVGAGNEEEFDNVAAKKWLSATYKALKDKAVTDALLLYDTIRAKKLDVYQFGRAVPMVAEQITYQFNRFKSESNEPNYQLRQFVLITDDKESEDALKEGIKHGSVIADAVTTTKNLANMPPNICNADYLAEQGQILAQRFSKLETRVLGKDELAKLGMNAYLAVGQGSQNASKLTVLEYKGAKDQSVKPIVLVGKGLTFDSGGISIKPAAGMDEMKYDMCGAATVYGVMQAIAELKLPLNVVGMMAGCENMPSGTAYRPGDILSTLSGQTVEVINTDAEGRLVLCDVLSYASGFNPAYVIDIATLTGACVVALGHHYTGLIANDDQLANLLLNAANISGDKTWRLPMDDDFQKQIDSPFADIANAAGRDGGTITAGCFLSRFTKGYNWAHLDIAGTAWTTGSNKGATGRPVNLLVQFMLDLAKVK